MRLGSGTLKNPALDFAIRFEMLTDDEIEDVRKGLCRVYGRHLQYSNGDRIPIYPERRIDLLARKLLGLGPDDD